MRSRTCQCGIHRMSFIDGGENQERVKCQESIQGLRIESRINRIKRIKRSLLVIVEYSSVERGSVEEKREEWRNGEWREECCSG